MTYSDIPPLLTHRAVKRWCVFRLQFSPDKPVKKIPYQPSGRKAYINYAPTWSSFAECMKAIDFGIGQYPGIALTKEFHLCCIDLDKCINSDGEYSAIAIKYLELFKSAAYIERSLSGTGLHILFWYTGKSVPPVHPEPGNGVEIFTDNRFIIFTGDTVG